MTTTWQSSKPRKLFPDPKLRVSWHSSRATFTQLVRAISSLQERLPLMESIGILEMVQMRRIRTSKK
ncbi:Hypothetical protein FKW44_019664 [Caligus rogercresseyi]|uniref:Uncharacterized protein n=1 Tax=Caligus rogercresseyi TaxID=217165 RepID=A0A7T8GWX1_CALRO|nr:Hypothetical protein FKW44_019664 [Caligus rogercresseyi]